MPKPLKHNSNYSIWLLIATLFFLVSGIISNVPATKISFYSISAFLISFAIYKKTTIISRGSLTIRMIVLSPMLQFVYITIFFLVGGSTLIYANFYHIDIGESPFRIVYSLLVLPVSVLVGAYLFKQLFIRFYSFNYKIQSISYDRRFEILLIVSAFNLIFYRIGVMRLPILSVALSFLNLGLTLTPFLIGCFSIKYKLPTKVFFAVFIITAILAFAEGSRSHIFIPIALFILGYIQNISFRKRILSMVIALFFLPIIFSISGGIEAVRGNIRSYQAYTTISSDLAEMTKNVSSYVKDDYNIAIKAGLARMIVWSNLAVVTMTPGPIPYRGFSDLAEEIKMRLKFSFMEPYSAEDEAVGVFGTGAANNYGFAVSHGGTVPFPVFADTWSRGGFIYTSISVILMCLIFGVIEKKVIVMFSQRPYISLFFITILSSIAFVTFSIYSLIYTIKFLFLSTVVWIFLLKFYIFIFNVFNSKVVHS